MSWVNVDTAHLVRQIRSPMRTGINWTRLVLRVQKIVEAGAGMLVEERLDAVLFRHGSPGHEATGAGTSLVFKIIHQEIGPTSGVR